MRARGDGREPRRRRYTRAAGIGQECRGIEGYMNDEQSKETATLAGGCFWCLEAVYKELRGVERVVSGYAGGHVERPTYREVCEGTTGHAEVVQITFDPALVSYRELLEV